MRSVSGYRHQYRSIRAAAAEAVDGYRCAQGQQHIDSLVLSDAVYFIQVACTTDVEADSEQSNVGTGTMGKALLGSTLGEGWT